MNIVIIPIILIIMNTCRRTDWRTQTLASRSGCSCCRSLAAGGRNTPYCLKKKSVGWIYVYKFWIGKPIGETSFDASQILNVNSRQKECISFNNSENLTCLYFLGGVRNNLLPEFACYRRRIRYLSNLLSLKPPQAMARPGSNEVN